MSLFCCSRPPLRARLDAIPTYLVVADSSRALYTSLAVRRLTVEDLDVLFTERGSWAAEPADWGDPGAALNQRQFLDIVEACLEKLPPNTARVFMMREVMELETAEICKELAITANNLWVILYRARMALRLCLEQHWFVGNGGPH